MKKDGIAARYAKMNQDVGYALGSGVTIMAELVRLLEADVVSEADRKARIKQAKVWIKDVDGWD